MVFIRSASTVIPPVRSSKKSGTLQELASANNSGKKTMMKILNALKGNKSGASAAEYALIVAVLGGFVVLGATAFGGSLQSAMTQTGTALDAEASTTF